MAKREYEVKLPFRPVGYMRLSPPVIFPHSIHIEQSNDDYLASVTLRADDAAQALDEAARLISDLLGMLALADGAFLLLRDDKRTLVKRLNAPYVADGPPPPFEVIGGFLTKAGAKKLDPTGKLRRAGRVVNIHVKAVVTHNNIHFESRALLAQTQWSNRLRKAVAVFHQAVCTPDPSVSFVLCYTTLEVLSGDDTIPLLRTLLPEPKPRRELSKQLRGTFQNFGFQQQQIDRLLQQVQGTRQESQLDSFVRYFQTLGIPIDRDELNWCRTQRSRYVHGGLFGLSEEAKKRREVFKKQIRQAIRQEIAQRVGGTTA